MEMLELSEDGKTLIGVNDKNITHIDIPNSVQRICSNAFEDCSALNSINVSENSNHYASIDGILFNKDLTSIIQFPIGKKIEMYE